MRIWILAVMSMLSIGAAVAESPPENPVGSFTALSGGVENTYKLTTEETYYKDQQKILEFFRHGISGHFQGQGNKDIQYLVFPHKPDQEKGAIVISSGRTEGFIIYPELIYDLGKQGYSIYIHDHRGQGFSERMTQDTQKGHIDSFDNYVKDLKTFVDTVVRPKDHHNLFLLAHSMGGGIASLYIEEYPKDFKAAVLVTPMHEPLLPVKGKDVTGVICAVAESWTAQHIFPPDGYAKGQVPYSPATFKDNDLTHSKVRFEKKVAILSENKQNETAKIGGPTHKWIREACEAGKKARADAAKISIPVLLLQASGDTAVRPEAQLEFCKNVNSGGKGGECQGYVVEQAYHAIFMEADTFRIPALTKALEFLANNTK
ncbi:MAG: alpha/beta fold hydrolase [Proteobacteria bacterium]|nr:alpha/beta fold hydrolase [Pseudomonadota bacterium]